jgi:5,10-methylenetetrahydromethanopterin reductase
VVSRVACWRPIQQDARVEFWLHGFAVPGRVAETARRAEAWGFAGLLLADSQNVTADIWVELSLAAAATSRLRIGPGVTNPVSRHIAVTASAAATLQRESNGRVSLGIGKGDSALSQIGLRALTVRAFEQALANLQGLLRGEEVALPGGTASRIRWIAADPAAKVPLHVAATGPRTIAAAARHAEGVDLTVGAEVERVARGVAIARDAAPAPIQVGAYLNLAVDPNPALARELVRGSVATFARFSAGAADLSAETGRGVDEAAGGYQLDHHGEAHAGSGRELEDAFIDRFAIAGTPELVLGRLEQMRACGIDRVIVVPGSLDSDPHAVDSSCERFAREIIAGQGSDGR